MAGGGWIVSARFLFSGNAISYVERLTRAQTMADVATARLTGKINAQEAAFLRNRIAADRAAMAHRNFVATSIAGSVALVGALGIGYALDQAGKLQQTLLSIKNETGADPRKLAGIGGDVYNIANQNGMSVLAAAEIWRTVSRLTAGQMDVAHMRTIAPLVARFASVLNFNRPDVSVDQAARVGLSTAHLFRAYTATALNPLLDKVYRLSGLISESPDQALRQMSYYVPMFKGLHISDDQSVAMMALLDRAGFRNKVGTNVRAMMLEALGPLQQTTHAQAGKAAMLEQMGIFKNGKFAFTQKDGSVDFLGVLRQVSQWEQAKHKGGETVADLTKTLYSVFGRQGGTIASLMADPRMVAFLNSLARYQHDPNVGLEAGERNRNMGMNYQFMRAANNLQSVLVELGSPWMADLAGFFKGIADRAHDFQAFLHGHRDIEKSLGGVAGILTASAGLIAAIGGTSRVLVFLGILKEMPNTFRIINAPFRAFGTTLRWLGRITPVVEAAFSRIGGAIMGLLGRLAPLLKWLIPGVDVAAMVLATTASVNTGEDALLNRAAVNALKKFGPMKLDSDTRARLHHLGIPGFTDRNSGGAGAPQVKLTVNFHAPVTKKDANFLTTRINQAVRQAIKQDPAAAALFAH